jgi:hypothetical protein
VSNTDPIHIEVAEPPESSAPPCDDGPKLVPPMTISISEQTHQADMRRRSIELAYLRGHLRRN